MLLEGSAGDFHIWPPINSVGASNTFHIMDNPVNDNVYSTY